ncbi:MAG: hypothetical protein A2W03_08565 [Candidatus Aminicenantes bacterium RBG_16_63_16]|nr:MAG: hypothetical protein A2W03_08565 [Candidatus Aminicenantes bacterium RBG_16_63_16]
MSEEDKMKRKALLAGALFLSFGVIGLLGQIASTQGPEGAVLTGTWYWETVMPTGGALPSVLVFHSDGTVVASGGIAFGGTPTNIFRYTPFQGVWERIGPHEFRATFYSLRFDGASGLLVGVARKRTQFWFVGDFDHFAGTMRLDVLPCTSPVTCPDPLSAPVDAWQPFNPPPAPTEVSIHAARISSVPY